MVSLYNLRASQIARVIGNDDYCSRQNHFAILIGEKEDKPVNEIFTSHGHECEKYGVAHVMIATQSLVVDCGSELLGSQFTMTEDYMSTDDTLVQLSCTPDGFIDEKNSVVEIKSPYFVQEDFDKYIKRYLPQVYFQQYLVRRNSRKNNADGTYFCIYQMGNTKLYYIPYNEDYINNYMLPKVDEFARYLLKGSLDKDFLTKRKSKESFIYNGEVQYNECI